jgi:uncharacterized membrane protein HdeD (DUF308 family)
MANHVEMASPTQGPRAPTQKRRLRGALILLMGCLSVAAAFFAGPLALTLVGVLLCACGALEMYDTFYLPDEERRLSDYFSGLISVVTGALLLSHPQLVLRGLVIIVAGSFLIDGVNKLIAAWRGHTIASQRGLVAAGIVNLTVGLVLVARWPVSGLKAVVILVGVRLVVEGWSMLVGHEPTSQLMPDISRDARHPDDRLGLPAHAEFEKLLAGFNAEEVGRRRIDAAWRWTFVLVFFAIHIGRMPVEWNLVGMISPLVAVLGDVATALFISFGIVVPFEFALRQVTRPFERRGWKTFLAQIDQGHGRHPNCCESDLGI